MEETMNLYSFKDLLEKFEIQDEFPMLDASYSGTVTLIWSHVKDFMSDLASKYKKDKEAGHMIPSFITTNKIYYEKMLKLLFNRWYYQNIYLIIAKELNDESILKWALLFMNKLELSGYEFVKIIKTQEEYLTNISNEIKSTSKSSSVIKHNDTPTSYGNYSADNYMSDLSNSSNDTESVASVDQLTRYNQVRNTIENTYQNWMNEFKEFEIWI